MTTATVPSQVDDAASHRRTATRIAVTASLVPAVSVAVVLAVVVWLVSDVVVGIVAGLVVGAAIGAIYFSVMRAAAVPGLLRVIKAERAGADRFARYVNLIEGLCISSGIAEPELFFVEDDRINLMVVGRPGEAAMVVTSGLLEDLNRVELEGVLSEGLVRIRSYDAHLASQAATFLCGTLLRNGPVYPGRPMWMVKPLAGWRATRLRAALGEQRDMLADLDAVSLTRYPPGLCDAFKKADARGTAVPECSWGAAHLWILDPLSEVGPGTDEARLNELFRNHPPLRHRIDLLDEL
jgi:heat shock protein HtpX